MASIRTLALVVLLVLGSAVGGAALAPRLAPDSSGPTAGVDPADPFVDDSADTDDPTAAPLALVTSGSAAEYRAYVRRGRQHAGGYGVAYLQSGGPTLDVAREATVTQAAATQSGGDGASGGADGGGAPRHSETNVQVAGIDEPDVIKTDGEHIYYSGSRRYATQVVDALPAGEASPVARVPDSGKLLLVGETLVVLGEERVVGYDVSDPADPEQRWERRLDAHVRTARLHDGTVYLLLATGATRCPVEPLGGTAIDCSDVHHPDRPLPVDATYTALTLDPDSGEVGDSFSFAGTRDATVYMSPNALYVTYTETASRADVQLDVLLGPARPLLPDHVAERLETVRGYDLSPRARSVEVQRSVGGWLSGLDRDERTRVARKLADHYADYVSAHKRDLTTTHVVRVPVGDGLGDPTVGAVPGRPLNQFSLDEHDGHLRIATTVGERWRTGRWGGGPAPDDGGVTSENDVYVLDAETLETTGSVTGMGETERVYSVRFEGDTGYVVTYRRVDPFHVLDLSDPDDPELAGELKLPGYSTYLHPLGDDRVLGVGEQDGKVKLVVFDVSDPADPTIAESRVLDARWSAVSRSHHAFLLDPRHEVFFLPTQAGGQVFDYDLDRVTRIDVRNPRRAVYVGDHLYVAGDDMVVVDERTWERVTRVDLY